MGNNIVTELVNKSNVSRVAEKLGYSYTYVYQMAKGIKPLTYKARRRIASAYKMHAPTVTTRYEPADPRRERALSLTMEERRAALDRAYHKKLMEE